jgi:hypothetical protein
MKHLITTLLLVAGLTTFAQNGFIEVEVTDTVWMKPVSFEYNISVKNQALDYDYVEGEDFDPQKFEEDSKNKMESLRMFLVKKGYTPKPITKSITPLRIKMNDEGFTVTLKSAQQLKKLEEELKTLDYAEGSMGDADFGDEAAYDAALFKKLIERGRKKGQVIASASGLKLGKITEIKEASGDTGMEGYMKEAMKVFEGMQSKVITGDNGSLHGETSKTITIKFAAE